MLPLRNFMNLSLREIERRERAGEARRRELSAAWDAERAKGRGGLGLRPDDIGIYDDINSKTYSGSER